MSIDMSGPRVSAPVPPPGGRPALSRRSLVRGAVWATPVIALTAPAPAFAASCTQLYSATLDWGATGAYTRTDASNGTGQLTASNGVPIALTLKSVFTNYTAATTGVRPTPNLGVTPIAGQTPPTIGAIGAAALTLTQTANKSALGVFFTGDSANRQEVTFTFAPKVYRVEFTVTDIDAANTSFDDAIILLDQATTNSVPAGSTVSGAGTLGSPAAQTTNTVAYDNFSSPGGNFNVVVTNPAGFTSFRLLYYNRLLPVNITSTAPLQTVYVSTLTAFAKNAGC